MFNFRPLNLRENILLAGGWYILAAQALVASKPEWGVQFFWGLFAFICRCQIALKQFKNRTKMNTLDDLISKTIGMKIEQIYTFHRAEGFYPLEMKSDEEAIANAKCNPGTLRVEHSISGRTVWSSYQKN